jgi:hypothetical protein
MSREVFISYRREDDAGMALALHAHLTRALSEECIFMDVEDGIPPGHDFIQVLEERVAECKIMLVLIGRRWLTAQIGNGERRLDNPDDFVRIEVESAMDMGKTVIPVLINDTEMPRASDLPATMRPFARRQAVFITSKRLRADVEGLVRILQREMQVVDKAAGVTPVLAEHPGTPENSRANPNVDKKKPAQKATESSASNTAASWKAAIYIMLAILFAVPCIGFNVALIYDRNYGGSNVPTAVALTALFGGASLMFLICARGVRTNKRSTSK